MCIVCSHLYLINANPALCSCTYSCRKQTKNLKFTVRIVRCFPRPEQDRLLLFYSVYVCVYLCVGGGVLHHGVLHLLAWCRLLFSLETFVGAEMDCGGFDGAIRLMSDLIVRLLLTLFKRALC